MASKFPFEVERFKKHFPKMLIQQNLFMCISRFLNNLFVERPVATTVTKLELQIVLPFLGSIPPKQNSTNILVKI